MTDSPAPPDEHLVNETFNVSVYYPNHEPRTESETFRQTKEEGDKERLPCFVCGASEVEYHHLLLEWADSNAVDWRALKDIATGKQTIVNGHPAKFSLIYWLTVIAKHRGFDWENFDVTKPETFVDGMAQMLPLCEKHHRAPDLGIHMMPWPIWVLQCFPLVKGFVEEPNQ